MRHGIAHVRISFEEAEPGDVMLPGTLQLLQLLSASMLTHIRSSRASSLLVTVLVLVATSACSERNEVVGRQPQLSVHAGSVQTTYLLHTVDGIPVPHFFKGEAGECDEMIKSGTYTISGNHWSAQDMIELKCPEALAYQMNQPRHWSGALRRSGDTLLFLAKISTGEETQRDRGIIRGDSLTTAGEDYGPTRVYVRSTSP